MKQEQRLPEPSFVDDLRFAAATWRRFPWLPIVSVALGTVSNGFVSVEGPFTALWLVAAVVYAGWIGTERICYLRSARGRRIELRELRRFTTSFILRYALLAILFGLLLIPLFLIFLVGRDLDDVRPIGTGSVIAATVIGLVLDVALTFVTPALAFTTRRTSAAVRLGLRMIWTEWPTCLPYVAIPSLVLVVGSRVIIGDGHDQGLTLVASGLGAGAGLWFKGAIAAYYLRRHWTGDDGAAFIDAPTSAPIIGEIPSRPDL